MVFKWGIALGFNTLNLIATSAPFGAIRVVTSSYKFKSVQWSNSHPSTPSRVIRVINANEAISLEDEAQRRISFRDRSSAMGPSPPSAFPPTQIN